MTLVALIITCILIWLTVVAFLLAMLRGLDEPGDIEEPALTPEEHEPRNPWRPW